jgi:preprotein translocase subunit SecD
VSPVSSRAQARQRRNLLFSVLAVLAISLGSFAAVFSARWTPRLGLDLAGGLSVVYQTEKTVPKAQLDQAVDILNNRVNGLCVSGAEVSTSPFQIPKPANGAKPEKSTSGNSTLPACGSSYATTEANLAVTPNSSVQGYSSSNPQPDPQFLTYTNTSTTVKNYENRDVLLPTLPATGTNSSKSALRYVLGPSEMTGHSIASASAQQDQTGQWVVNYSLAGSTGSALWDKVAQENFHQLLGIELDGVVYSAPIIQPAQGTFSSFDGQGEISGSLTQADAQRLAQAMQFGSLPVRLKELTTQTVSPTLGKSALKAGLGAGVVGLALVLLYVLFYYRALGAVVISGLALTAAMLWAIISALGHTSFSPSFDLAGITGLIVSIGITVDSYIVYFERLKDETRSGRSIRTSVDRGFKSAWRTVWAADFVSLLAAIVLYEVAVGDVKGFAFFLGLSTIMDMGVTWFYTRPLVILLGRSDRLTTAGRFGIARGLAVERQTDFAPVGAGK